MDYAALAQQFGGALAQKPQSQPVAQDWTSGLSPKDQAEIQMGQFKEAQKRIADMQEQVSRAGSIMADIEEFGALNRKSSTGSWWQQLTPDKQMFRTPDSMRMSAITSRLAPAQRPVGSGATSDRDMALYLRALPSIENEGPVNMGIRQDFERNYQSGLAKLKAAQEYLNAYGHLNGFDNEWANRGKRGAGSVQRPTSGVPAQDAISAELARRGIK